MKMLGPEKGGKTASLVYTADIVMNQIHNQNLANVVS